MKKSMKALNILLLILLITLVINVTPVNAEDINISGFKPTSSATGDKVKDGSNVVIGIIQAIGITAAVIMLIMVAIKYLSEGAEGKAEIKKKLIPYVIGAVLLFAATGILGIFQGFANEIAPSEKAPQRWRRRWRIFSRCA